MTSTALTVVQRASVAIGAAEHEKKLVELAKQSLEITTITNPDGYRQCHAARMVLKTERVNLERLGKDSRDDATKFSKAVIAEERRLIGIIEPEEKRLAAIQAEWDAIEERKRQAEADRIAKLQAGIEAISAIPVSMVGKPSAEVAERLDSVRGIAVDTFAELEQFAQEAKDRVIAALTQLHAGAIAQEQAAAAEAKRLVDEREELARLRAEQQERERAEAKLMEEAIARRMEDERLARERIESAERESRERIAEQERLAQAARDAEDARLAKEREAREAEERERRAAAEADAKTRAEAQAAEDARLKAERDELEAKQREIQRQADELLSGADMLRTFVDRYGRRKEFEQVVVAIKTYLAKQPKQQRKAA